MLLPVPATRANDRVLLAGDRLMIQRGTVLLVYDIADGRLLERVRLAGPEAQIESANGNLVAYNAGIVLHVLCLRSQHDHVLELPSQGDLPTALFSTRGLYVGYNAIASPPGRVLGIPLEQLGSCS